MADKSDKHDGIEPNPDNPSMTITHETPHPADETSAPVELPDTVERPPVSTADPHVDIAGSLAAGAGAHQPAEDEEEQLAKNPAAPAEEHIEKIELPKAPK
jgi:hypothetical protein